MRDCRVYSTPVVERAAQAYWWALTEDGEIEIEFEIFTIQYSVMVADKEERLAAILVPVSILNLDLSYAILVYHLDFILSWWYDETFGDFVDASFECFEPFFEGCFRVVVSKGKRLVRKRNSDEKEKKGKEWEENSTRKKGRYVKKKWKGQSKL